MCADQPHEADAFSEPEDSAGETSFQEPADEDESAFVQATGEDEADIAVGAASRALDEEQIESAEPVQPLPPRASEEDVVSDVVAEAGATTPPTYAAEVDISVLKVYEGEVHDVIVELKSVEAEVRRLVEERDPKRKRKLSGTHRWHELEEDIIGWRFSGRFDETTLRRVQELIARRHYLFRHLHFLAGTRPVWNS